MDSVMHLARIKQFGPVTACELGWSIAGRPSWTVHLYLVDGICIDTGQSNMRRRVIQLLETRHLQQIVLTHHHEDHSGNAAVLAAGHKIPVYGHPLAVEKMKSKDKIRPYQHYIWGASTPVPMRRLPATVESNQLFLKPIHTPGHSKDHTVFYEEKNGWLFSGDLYLADRIKYFRSDECMVDQIASLKKISSLDFQALFCAHNPKPTNGKVHILNKLQFLEDLYGEISILWEKGFTVNQIIDRTGLKESHLVRSICLGNVSMRNMVRSAAKSLAASNSHPMPYTYCQKNVPIE
jgi:glyoxylase-like metal-dependent hydrolase (beta-lactamase superfamily II)